MPLKKANRKCYDTNAVEKQIVNAKTQTSSKKASRKRYDAKAIEKSGRKKAAAKAAAFHRCKSRSISPYLPFSYKFHICQEGLSLPYRRAEPQHRDMLS